MARAKLSVKRYPGDKSDPLNSLSTSAYEALMHILGLDPVLREVLGKDFAWSSWLIKVVTGCRPTNNPRWIAKLASLGFLRTTVKMWGVRKYVYSPITRALEA